MLTPTKIWGLKWWKWRAIWTAFGEPQWHQNHCSKAQRHSTHHLSNRPRDSSIGIHPFKTTCRGYRQYRLTTGRFGRFSTQKPNRRIRRSKLCHDKLLLMVLDPVAKPLLYWYKFLNSHHLLEALGFRGMQCRGEQKLDLKSIIHSREDLSAKELQLVFAI